MGSSGAVTCAVAFLLIQAVVSAENMKHAKHPTFTLKAYYDVPATMKYLPDFQVSIVTTLEIAKQKDSAILFGEIT